MAFWRSLARSLACSILHVSSQRSWLMILAGFDTQHVSPPAAQTQLQPCAPKIAVTQAERSRLASPVCMSTQCQPPAPRSGPALLRYSIAIQTLQLQLRARAPHCLRETGEPGRAGSPVCMWALYLHSLPGGGLHSECAASNAARLSPPVPPHMCP